MFEMMLCRVDSDDESLIHLYHTAKFQPRCDRLLEDKDVVIATAYVKADSGGFLRFVLSSRGVGWVNAELVREIT